MRLCQITALLTGKKTAAVKDLTAIYHRYQKPVLFQGLSKRFIPKEDDTDPIPDDNQRVQHRVNNCLGEVRAIMVNLFDLVATQDKSNCAAKADVKVGETVVLTDVPVTYLLFLEKQLTDLGTALGAIPTLDPQEDWMWSDDAGYYVTAGSEVNKTKKTVKVLVKYPASVEHPAQTEVYNDDVVIGQMRTVKFSAAIPAQDKNRLLDKIIKLRDAVKIAREEANSSDVVEAEFGEKIFDFLGITGVNP